jgi:hypothetical protein
MSIRFRIQIWGTIPQMVSPAGKEVRKHQGFTCPQGVGSLPGMLAHVTVISPGPKVEAFSLSILPKSWGGGVMIPLQGGN